MRVIPIVLGLSGFILVNACGGGGTSPLALPDTPVATTAVFVGSGGNVFTPKAIVAPVAASVTWTWDSCTTPYGGTTTCVSHNLVFDDGAPGSGLKSSGTFVRAFNTAGSYGYHCGVHPTMIGSVKIQ
ncbi:MAG: cupredoxin family copper-binding protein [Gemmatimonadaceae bacterium]